MTRIEYWILYALHLSIACGVITGAYGALVLFVSIGARF